MGSTCIYEVDFVYHSCVSRKSDNQHAKTLVEAPEDIFKSELENLCKAKFPSSFSKLNSFKKAMIHKLV